MKVWVVANLGSEGLEEPIFTYSSKEAAEIHTKTGSFQVIEQDVLEYPAEKSGLFAVYLDEIGNPISVFPRVTLEEAVQFIPRSPNYDEDNPGVWEFRPFSRPTKEHAYGVVRAASADDAVAIAKGQILK